MKITDRLIKDHGLTREEYERIVEYLGRAPNIVELGIFSAMWSEHCSYKSSRIYLKEFPTEGRYVIQGPGENAGIVDIGDGFCIAFKMESHNHPSYIEPYQGAATGVGGILRDIFTMGARPLASLDSLRFGPLKEPRNRFLLEGVVSGIAGYGNCVGVPTVGGEVYFHESYNGNCLVNVMTVGLVRKERIFRARAGGVGNPLMYVGAKTGRDGIHGAVMASDVFGEGGEERRPTVQVGDPFSEKLLLEACLELFKTDCVVGIQDMGAAGLTSSSVEMASRGGTGIEIDITRVPRREEGMTPYEVMLSESQERMLIVVRKGSEDTVKRIFNKWGLDACVIGMVTGDGKLRVKDGDETVAEIPVKALTDNAPVYRRPSRVPSWQDGLKRLNVKELPLPADFNGILLRLVSSENLSSRRWIYRQYDHMVRTNTVVQPGSDASVIRIKGTNKAIAMTVDCNSLYCHLDPFTGGAIAVAEASRNLVVSGAKPLALTDCLNFGNPEREEVMWQFREVISGMKNACLALDVPVVSGNVSFYNETSGKAIHPTPTVGMVGLIEDMRFCTTQWFKDEGDLVLLLGETGEELGGTEYLRVIHGLERGVPPRIDLEKEKNLQSACSTAIRAGIIKSAHDVSEGGFLVALVEKSLSPERPLGVSVEMDIPEDIRPDAFLFGETQSRIIVTVGDKKALERLREICDGYGVPVSLIGVTRGRRIRVNDLVDIPIQRIMEVWESALEDRLKGKVLNEA